MRPIYKGDWPLTPRRGWKMAFNDWTKAIPILKTRTGSYCHLCEMKVTNAIAIEHIFPKEHYPRLENHWSNFLLICNTCNSKKGSTIPNSPYRYAYYWPHLHNTFMAFDYRHIVPFPSNSLNGAQQMRAKKLIQLYKLDDVANATGEPDNRHIQRLEATHKAIKRLLEYLTGKATVEAIVDMATATGFFSVWMTIFNDVPLVKQALLSCSDFHLANQSQPCFDFTTCAALPRNPSKNDPI